jgi:gamma-glutamylputrescine oxidase
MLYRPPLAPDFSVYACDLLPGCGNAPLEEETETEVAIIGGGLLGVSTALHLAQSGVACALLEKATLGAGASGRNGGQLVPGLARWKAKDLQQTFPADEARWLWSFAAMETMGLLTTLMEQYRIDAEYRPGHLTAAVHPGHMQAPGQESAARAALGDDSTRLIDARECGRYINASGYHGALLDTLGGQIQPLKLLYGLWQGYQALGGRTYEHTPALSIEPERRGYTITTPSGRLLARKAVVLAVHADTPTLLPAHRAVMLPLYTYLALTTPIPEGSHSLLPGGLAVYDTRVQIDYYRAYGEDRLLFGGLGTGRRMGNGAAARRPGRRLRSVFPQCPQLRAALCWSGRFDITRSGMPVCTRSAGSSPLYAVHGWNGHGVGQSVRIGKAISDDVLGKNHDFTRLTRFRHSDFPLSFLPDSWLAGGGLAWSSAINALNPQKMNSF